MLRHAIKNFCAHYYDASHYLIFLCAGKIKVSLSRDWCCAPAPAVSSIDDCPNFVTAQIVATEYPRPDRQWMQRFDLSSLNGLTKRRVTDADQACGFHERHQAIGFLLRQRISGNLVVAAKRSDAFHRPAIAVPRP